MSLMGEKLHLMDKKRKWYIEMEVTDSEDAVILLKMTIKELEGYIKIVVE